MDPSALDGETAHEKGPSVPLERVGLIGGGLAETAVRGVCISTFLYVPPGGMRQVREGRCDYCAHVSLAFASGGLGARPP